MSFIRSHLIAFCLLSNSAVHFALPATMYVTTMSNRANRNRQNVTYHLDPVLDLDALGDPENRPPGYMRPTKSAAVTEKAQSVVMATKMLTPSQPPRTESVETKAEDDSLRTTEHATVTPTHVATETSTGGATVLAQSTTGTSPRPTNSTSGSTLKPTTMTTMSHVVTSDTITTTTRPATTKTTSTPIAVATTSAAKPLDFMPSPPCQLNVSSLSPIKIIVTWQAPTNISLHYIAGYTIYYFRSKFKDKDTPYKSIKLVNTATFRDINSLIPGTNYTIFMTVNFTNKVSMKSGSVWAITKGYGPDRPCICDQMGAINTSICDAITGQCRCRGLYAGLSCGACRPGFYRFHRSPCASCPCNVTVSTGVCTTDHNQVMCMCRGDNIGPRCELCKNGYYLDNTTVLCKLCECHGNAKLNSPRICNENTGECFNCRYNTTGFNCEKCLPGYSGDAVEARNCTKLEVDNVPSSPGDIMRKLTHRGHVVIGVSVTFGLIFFVIIGVLGCKRYLNWRRWQPQPFWTVELKDDHETVSFSSMVDQEYQNVDAALLMDDVGYYDRSMQGQLRVKSPENTPSYHSINA